MVQIFERTLYNLCVHSPIEHTNGTHCWINNKQSILKVLYPLLNILSKIRLYFIYIEVTLYILGFLRLIYMWLLDV